jgi:hypothetical protein
MPTHWAARHIAMPLIAAGAAQPLVPISIRGQAGSLEHALVHAAAGGLGAVGLGAGMNAVKNSVVRNAIRAGADGGRSVQASLRRRGANPALASAGTGGGPRLLSRAARLFADAIVCRTAMHQHVEMLVRFMLGISTRAYDRSEIAAGRHRAPTRGSGSLTVTRRLSARTKDMTSIASPLACSLGRVPALS